MRLVLLAILLLAPVALAKDNKPRGFGGKQTVAFGGAAITAYPDHMLEAGGGQVERVKFGPKPWQVVSVATSRIVTREVIYTLTVTEFPDRLSGASPKAILAGARRGILGPDGTGGKLVSEDNAEVAGHPGLTLTMRAGKRNVRALVAVAEGRLIQLTAVGTPDALAAPEVEKVLDSLTIPGGAP